MNKNSESADEQFSGEYTRWMFKKNLSLDFLESISCTRKDESDCLTGMRREVGRQQYLVLVLPFQDGQQKNWNKGYAGKAKGLIRRNRECFV